MRSLCEQQGNCAGLSIFFPSGGYRTADKGLDVAALAVPGLIGMFWGAALIAREFETGTFRLAWTQGVTRTRWLAAKLGITGLAAIAAGELFSLMLNWWASPIHKAGGYTPFTSGIGSSYISGVAPAGTRRSRSPSASPPGSSSAAPCPRWPSPSPSSPPS